MDWCQVSSRVVTGLTVAAATEFAIKTSLIASKFIKFTRFWIQFVKRLLRLAKLNLLLLLSRAGPPSP